MILWLLVFVAFLGSMFFAGAETAFTAMNRLEIKTWAEGSGRRGRRARLIEAFTRVPDRFLTTTLVGNNICLVAVTSLVAYQLKREWAWGPEVSAAINVGVVTLVLLVGAEIFPKSVARNVPNRSALLSVGLIRVFHFFMKPVVLLVGVISRGFMRSLGLSPASDQLAPRREDVLHALQRDQGEAPGDEQIIAGIFDLGSTTVREALTPRTRLVCLDVSATEEEILETVGRGTFSRLPVFDGDIDRIVGTVHVRDLLLASRSGPVQLQSHLRRVPFVPEQKNVEELLEELRARREHMAVVVDEHGGTEGIVTLEDLLEVLVGVIRDEQDEPDRDIRSIDEDAWAVQGHVTLDDLEERIALVIPEGDYESVAGFVIHRLGRIPRKGEVVTASGVRITVLKATDRSVAQVRVDRTES